MPGSLAKGRSSKRQLSRKLEPGWEKNRSHRSAACPSGLHYDLSWPHTQLYGGSLAPFTPSSPRFQPPPPSRFSSFGTAQFSLVRTPCSPRSPADIGALGFPSFETLSFWCADQRSLLPYRRKVSTLGGGVARCTGNFRRLRECAKLAHSTGASLGCH